MHERTEAFSDSDWTRDPPLRARMPAAQRRALILTIAIAVSCVAVALVWYGVEQLLEASAQSEALKRLGGPEAALPHSDSSDRPAPLPAAPVASAAALPPTAANIDAPLQAVAPAMPASSPPAADAPRDSQVQQMVALEAEMRQRAQETAQQAVVEAARRKERAWQRYYQRPDYCSDNPTAAQMVQCANHHIRARKAFEERYVAGKL